MPSSSSPMHETSNAVDVLNSQTISLATKAALEPLFKKIGSARIVMLGEASHGTHEFYTWRSYITKRLIEEKKFNFIVVEGDWPDCYKINQFIKYSRENASIIDVLKTFNRWPTWMWANWEVAALAEWLKKYNQFVSSSNKIGFFGLDVYSLWESLNSIMQYLSKNDPAALEKAKKAARCFEPYKNEGEQYAIASRMVPDLCEDEVIALLKEIQKKLPLYDSGEENVFSAEQNALIAVNAEKYYRAMIKGGSASWNVRDMHMQETLERLLQFHGSNSKAIIWAHNTHIGDASATDMADEGMYSIGELIRKNYPNETFIVGFGSYKGSVIAGKYWSAPMQTMKMPEAKTASWENMLHQTGKGNQLLLMDDVRQTFFNETRIGHRAIGVVYNPQYEKYGNYVPSILPKRYDAFIFIDETKALHPLNIKAHKHETPETYPFGV